MKVFPSWQSQAGQDKWVADIFDWREGGFFIDVGAHDGVTHSNTYSLEKHHGWDGICIEPEATAFSACRDVRSCDCINVAVSSTCGYADFNGVLLGSGALQVETQTLTNILRAIDSPPVIDYLSIDVEGHELEVLQGMDFHLWHVNLITIEHNLYQDGPSRKNAIFEYLADREFFRAIEDVVAPGYGPYEDWYMNAALR